MNHFKIGLIAFMIWIGAASPTKSQIPSDMMITSGLYTNLSGPIATSVMPVPITTPTPTDKGGWYFSISPPHGGNKFDIGPWKNLLQCNDVDGSFMFSHPFACHNTGKHKDCGITGNGIAYPIGVPYPLPNNYKPIPGGCFQATKNNLPDKVYSLPQGKYFLVYYKTGGGTIMNCKKYSQMKNDPNVELGIQSKACGGPCFDVGTDTACE